MRDAAADSLYDDCPMLAVREAFMSAHAAGREASMCAHTEQHTSFEDLSFFVLVSVTVAVAS